MKRIIVQSCDECPYYSLEEDLGRGCIEWNFCQKSKKEISDIHEVPKWCELEDILTN